MIDRDHKLPLASQAKAVGISRGSIYYWTRAVLRVLQCRTAPFEPWGNDAGPVL